MWDSSCQLQLLQWAASRGESGDLWGSQHVLGHKDSERGFSSLMIMFHYMFDQGDLVGKIPDWDWVNASSWCEVHLMFGRAINKPMSGNGLCKMYKAFLDATSISSNKKAHLARWAVPTIMEDMGLMSSRVSADHIDVVGHWVGNVHHKVYGSKIPKQAVTALAGFYIGETYRVPWARVPVPDSLTKQVMAVIHAQFPNLGVVKRIQIVHHLGAQQFFSWWPDVVCAADGVCDADIQLSTKFCEDDTRKAFLRFLACLNNIEVAAKSTQDGVVSHAVSFAAPVPRSNQPANGCCWGACSRCTALSLNHLSTAGTQDTATTADISLELIGNALSLSHFSTTGTQDAAATADISLELVGDALGLSHVSITGTQDTAATAWDISSELIGDALGLNCLSIASTQDTATATATADIGSGLIGNVLNLDCLNIASTQDATTSTTGISSGLIGDVLGLNCLNIASTQDTTTTTTTTTTTWDIGSELIGNVFSVNQPNAYHWRVCQCSCYNLIATTWDIGSELIGDGPCTNHSIVISNCIYFNCQCCFPFYPKPIFSQC
ncbi:hypothetical protein EDB83DRAFT_2312080 [Lactarius deliciosus]|nr:hypothetical protein EDB83DRAFT_2312080 [Lactarius deliciosus]